MSHSYSGGIKHGVGARDFVRLRKSSVVQLAVNLTSEVVAADDKQILSRRAASSPRVGSAAAEETAFWNDASAKNFNLLIGFALLLVFLATLPRWIDFFSEGRGKKSGWRLSNGAAPSTFDKGQGEQSEKEDHNDSKIEIREKRRCEIKPVGAVTARVRTFRTMYLLRSVPLPFSLLSHLSIGQILICFAYQAMVLFSLFHHCHDHSTNWKRTGYIALAQLPAIFLVATKNTLTLLIGTSYEKLRQVNFLHRVAGRLAILASLLHTLLFLRKMGWNLNWDSATQRSGTIAILALVIMFISSLRIVRDTFYQFFLISHVLGFLTFLIAVQLHAPTAAQPYTIFCLVLYVVNIVIRFLKTRTTFVSLANLSSGTTMIQSQSIKDGWRAGQHVLIRAWTWRRWHEAHPFTVAVASSSESPLSSKSHKLTLLAKSTGGFTRFLESRSISPTTPIYCTIEGPYGHPLALDFARYQSVLLFAGGSGITFCASILEELVARAARGDSNNREVTLIWSMRDLECIEWYRSLFTSLVSVVDSETSLDLSIYLHVTSTPNLPSMSPVPNSYLSSTRPNSSAYLSRSISTLLYSLSNPDSSATSIAMSTVPNGGGLGVGVCGPQGLVPGMREAISQVPKERALKVGGIVLHEETFAC
ncbi:ferric reductase family protein [Sporobolomyces salmoneus]|uniref:ferric reductase family protein n=1 Tax=Sporobolomyces salmoneus TaxID=183962 RepID=UPI003170400C